MLRFLPLVLLASPALAEMTLTSPTISEGGTLPMEQVFNSFGCSGGNISPALDWTGAPEGTKSFAVTVYDPDAPTGSGWWHWGVFNLPAESAGLAAGASTGLPEGAIQSRTDFGAEGFGGACPPEGAPPHHYVFTVFALPDVLPPEAGASGAMLGFYLNAMALDRATLTATYGR